MLRITINNTEQKIDSESLYISQNITSKVDTCSFKYNKIGSRVYIPRVFDEVIIYDGRLKLFAGVITEFDDEIRGVNLLSYSIKCTDYTFLFDRKLVAETYERKSLSNIVLDIIRNFSTGFSWSLYGLPRVHIDFIQFDYVRPTDAIRDLAEMTGCDWYIDYDKRLNFFSRGHRKAPFNLSDDNNSYNYKSLKLKKSGKQIKNVIFVVGSDYVGDEVVDKIGSGDGRQKKFNLFYKYNKIPIVRLGGVIKTIGLEFLDDNEDFDCYWNASEKIISFKIAPVSGDIEVRGNPLIPLFVKVKAPNSNGDFEFKIIDKTLKTVDAVRKRARAEIDAYSNSIEEGSFTTTKKGLRAGDTILVSSAIRGISEEKYIIQSIDIKVLAKNEVTYKVKLANIKSYEIVEFLRALLRKGEKETGITKNPTSFLNTIISLSDKISVGDRLLINNYKKNFNDSIDLTDQTKIRKNYNNKWVWGDYVRSDINDAKKVPLWDRGVFWE